MQTLTQRTQNPLSGAEARQAEASSVALQRLMGKEEHPLSGVTLRVSVEQPGGETSELALPGVMLSLLSSILRELGRGKNVVVLAMDTEVTTQQAADFLKVSRPFPAYWGAARTSSSCWKRAKSPIAWWGPAAGCCWKICCATKSRKSGRGTGGWMNSSLKRRSWECTDLCAKSFV